MRFCQYIVIALVSYHMVIVEENFDAGVGLGVCVCCLFGFGVSILL
jgi:hypothetical protein